MAGLYIHIPFCRDACTYCDFHFSISMGHLDPMLRAIEKEIADEKKFLGKEELETIYFGGGTPSILSRVQLSGIINTIKGNYKVNKNTEITLEANPDDLNPYYLESIKKAGINRLSLGIQSFHDRDLEWMNRRHNSGQARKCITEALKAGFDNLSLDLIYGLPGMKNEDWSENLAIALEQNPAHIAAYHLGYEQGTVLDYRRRKGKIKPIDEKQSIEQFALLTETMETGGYQHYEISNFALPGRISRHNSAYWLDGKYLGTGPSAHSYNGKVRRWNISKNNSYIKGILTGKKVHDEEILDDRTKFHEYLMTALRTMWGLDLEYIQKKWGQDHYKHVLEKAGHFLDERKMSQKSGILKLEKEGMFLADHIIRELFL